MKRITEYVGTGSAVGKANVSILEILNKLAAYEDAGLTPERCAELARAEVEGWLAVSPCKVGDIIDLHSASGIRKYMFMGIIQQKGYLPALYGRQLWGDYIDVPIANIENWGKTVFLTSKEGEAEAALKRKTMQWLKWENGEEWGKIECPILGDKPVMTYRHKNGGSCYYSYTAPFIDDGCVCYYRYDHDEGEWDDVTFTIDEEYREGKKYWL